MRTTLYMLLEIGFNAKMSRKRPVQNDFNSLFGMPINIKKQKQKITEINGKSENGTSNGKKKDKYKSKENTNQNSVNISDKSDKERLIISSKVMTTVFLVNFSVYFIQFEGRKLRYQIFINTKN